MAPLSLATTPTADAYHALSCAIVATWPDLRPIPGGVLVAAWTLGVRTSGQSGALLPLMGLRAREAQCARTALPCDPEPFGVELNRTRLVEVLDAMGTTADTFRSDDAPALHSLQWHGEGVVVEVAAPDGRRARVEFGGRSRGDGFGIWEAEALRTLKADLIAKRAVWCGVIGDRLPYS